MRAQWNIQPDELKVWLGPGIRSCCYTVGEELLEVFGKRFIAEQGGDLKLDLPAVIRGQLLDDGIRAEHIADSRMCTCCDPNFFSFRREGAVAGRHLSLMTIEKASQKSCGDG